MLSDTRTEVLEALDRLNSMVTRRDLAVLSEFDDRADVLLVGPKEGEIADGPGAVTALFQHVFGLPLRIGWSWQNIRVSSSGHIAWLFAEGHVIMTGEAGQTKSPYRASGVLERHGNRWKWRQFHGSEPAVKR
jgi:ketosteroid isomerase-like protein